MEEGGGMKMVVEEDGWGGGAQIEGERECVCASLLLTS